MPKGALNEGLPYLSEAVDIDPNNSSVRYNFAVTLARLRQHDRAITQWQEILRRDGRTADTLSCLAAGYAESGRLDEALTTLDQALKLAISAGDQRLVEQIARQIGLYRQRGP